MLSICKVRRHSPSSRNDIHSIRDKTARLWPQHLRRRIKFECHLLQPLFEQRPHSSCPFRRIKEREIFKNIQKTLYWWQRNLTQGGYLSNTFTAELDLYIGQEVYIATAGEEECRNCRKITAPEAAQWQLEIAAARGIEEDRPLEIAPTFASQPAPTRTGNTRFHCHAMLWDNYPAVVRRSG